MDIVFDRHELLVALRHLNKIVPNKPTHPILGTILFKPTATGGFKLYGFDLKNIGCHQIFIFKGEPVEFCLPTPGTVIKLLQSFDQDYVTFSLNEDTTLLTISDQGGSEYKFSLFGSTEEYPDINLDISDEAEEQGQWFEVSNEHLEIAWKLIKDTSSTDSTVQVLEGANFIFKENRLTVQATDGHRASWYRCPIHCVQDDELNYLIDDSFVIDPTMIKAAMQNGERTRFCYSEGIVILKGFKYKDDGTPVETECWNGTRVIQGNFPRLEQLIPAKFDNTVSFNAKEMDDALSRIGIVSTRGIKFIFDDDIKIRTTMEDQTQAVEKLDGDIQVEEADNVIAFNYKYYAETISSLKELTKNDIFFAFNRNNQPAVFNLPGLDGGLLLMPITIKE